MPGVKPGDPLSTTLIYILSLLLIGLVCGLTMNYMQQRRTKRRSASSKTASAERELAIERSMEAKLNASWQPNGFQSWALQGIDSVGAIYNFAWVSIRSIGHGLYMVGYYAKDQGPEYDHPDSTGGTNNRILLEGDQFIGDEAWAVALAQKVTDGDWIPRPEAILPFITDVSQHYYDALNIRKDNKNLVTVGFVGSYWRNGIGIFHKKDAYPDEELWTLVWWGGHDNHRCLNIGTGGMINATSAATEAFRGGMPPRLEAWASLNQSA